MNYFINHQNLININMASYSKSLQDYFRIPILIKIITPLRSSSETKLQKTIYNKLYALPTDQNYIRQQQNANTDMLKNRQPSVQKLYFAAEDFSNQWPQFQVIYKTRYAVGIIDQKAEEKYIEEMLAKIKLENSVKLIGIIDMGTQTYQNLLKKENMIRYPDISDSQFRHFIEPWLYGCLAFIQSDICNAIVEAKRQDDTNRTIVFNRMEEKSEPKIMKRKKKYRCTKLCGDYYLMLQLYKEAFVCFNQSEEQLRKLDDYLWVLGSLHGKLACTSVSQSISLSNLDEYIDFIISECFVLAKKTKISSFQIQNYFKIIRLHLNQPDKVDEMVKNFLVLYAKSMHDDQKFLMFTVLGEVYQNVKLFRKANLCYFLAAEIHHSKTPELSQILLLEIQKSQRLKQWPHLYKGILQMIISDCEESEKTSQYLLEILSKCGNDLSDKQIQNVLSQLNFNNHGILELKEVDFISLKEFSVEESKIKPKQNRIGKRVVQKKGGPGFFISWKKDQNFLFEEGEAIVFRGAILNSILFPIRLKITFKVVCTVDPSKVISQPQFFCYIQPNNLHRFQSKVRIQGASQQIWCINQIELFLWNFKTSITLPHPIRFQIYEKQPQILLTVEQQLRCEQSSNLCIEAGLIANLKQIPSCLIRLSVSIYYTLDVGFQQNQISLRQDQNFKNINFNNKRNVMIIQTNNRDTVDFNCTDGVLLIELKKLKVHRKFISRIQFNLEYIRSETTKYQSSKHYVSKCNFYRSFTCEVDDISTPIIQKIYKTPINNIKIIEKCFLVRLKMTKFNASVNSSSYKVYHGQKEYIFRQDNTVQITFSKQKLRDEKVELAQIIRWQNIFHQRQRGEMKVLIPFHPLMKKSLRQIQVLISRKQQSNSRKKLLSYTIRSEQKANLSHELVLTPEELQIDRMFVLSGKTKVQSPSVAVSLTN